MTDLTVKGCLTRRPGTVQRSATNCGSRSDNCAFFKVLSHRRSNRESDAQPMLNLNLWSEMDRSHIRPTFL